MDKLIIARARSLRVMNLVYPSAVSSGAVSLPLTFPHSPSFIRNILHWTIHVGLFAPVS